MEGKQTNIKDWSQSAPPRRGRGRPKGKPTPLTAAEKRRRNAELERERRDSLGSAYSEARQAIGLHDTATRQETLVAATEYIKRHAARDSLVALRRQNSELQRQIIILKKARRQRSSQTAPTIKLEPSSASNDTDHDNILTFVPFKTELLNADTETYTTANNIDYDSVPLFVPFKRELQVNTESYTSYPDNTQGLSSFPATPKISPMRIFAGTPEDQNPMLSSVNVKVTAWGRPHTVVTLPEGYLTPTEEYLTPTEENLPLFPELE